MNKVMNYICYKCIERELTDSYENALYELTEQ